MSAQSLPAILNRAGCAEGGGAVVENLAGASTNSGTITAAGAGGLGVSIGGPATFINTATGPITSQQASGVIANGGGTISNAGTIIVQVTGITSANGAAIITNSGIGQSEGRQQLMRMSGGIIDGNGNAEQGDDLFWQPYLKLNLWHGFEGDDEVVFGGSDTVSSEHRLTAL